MSDPNADLLSAFDGHVVEDVRAALEAGADPSSSIDGKLATDWLLEEYHRTDRLSECLRLLLDSGVHRAEVDIYNSIRILLAASGRPVPPLTMFRIGICGSSYVILRENTDRASMRSSDRR